MKRTGREPKWEPSNRVKCYGWDAYRLWAITPAGADVATYEAKMKRAYEAVYKPAPTPEPVTA